MADVALVIALNKLVGAGEIPVEVFKPQVAAVSVGILDGQPLLDLCYQEDAIADVDVNVVMNAEGDFIEVQGTAEANPFGRAALDEMLDLAHKGIMELFEIQKRVIGE